MRSLWKGSLAFGLVNIPVRMYSATHEKELKFTMLHKKDLSEIRYARMCKAEDKEVPWKDIVKGYEYSKGDYVVFQDEDFEKANLKKTKTIEIVDFVKEDEIETVYYEKPYFLEPEKNADNAYSLLRDALIKSGKVGIAKFVLRNREHLAVIKPYEGAIAVIQLRYNEELAQVKELTIPEAKKASPKELTFAIKLIDQLTVPFKPEKYKDTYIDEIKELIKQKAKGKPIHPKSKEPAPSKVLDMMSLLKESLDQNKKKPTRKRKTA